MKRSILALALLATLPFAAQASDLSYSYVEAGYTRITGVGDKTDGYGLNGSLALGSSFHLFGGFNAFDISGTPVDVDTWNFGVGYNHSLSDSTDLIARLGYAEFDISGFSAIQNAFDTDSFFTEVGVRSQLAPSFEGYVFAGYERPDVGGGDTYGRLGGQYSFNSSWGLIADVKFGGGAEQYFIGPRFTF